MFVDMYKKLDDFRNYITKEKEVDGLINLGKENGFIIPNAMLDFYRHFGNDEAFLKADYLFHKVEDICIEDRALMFGYKSKKCARLGIKITPTGDLFSSVSSSPKGMHSWYGEGILGLEHFFFDFACWQILNMMSFISKMHMKRSDFEEFMTKKFQYFCTDKMFTTGGGIYSGYYTNVLACYLSLEEELYVAAKEERDLKNIEQEFGLKLKIVKPTGNKEKLANQKGNNKLKKQSDVLKKINLEDMYQRLDVFRKKVTEEKNVDKLLELTTLNTVVIPKALVDFYRHFGNDNEFLNAYYNFDRLEDICIENGALAFGYTDQNISRLGIMTASLETPYEVVCFGSIDSDEWNEEETVPLEIFLFHIAAWQILNTMTNVATVDMTNRKLNTLIKKSVQYFSANELYTKNKIFRVVHYKNILGCYIVENEILYVAASEDGDLEEFGKEFNLDLDWL